jgi:citrate lyase subunit beta/citryl-CoA lyase
MRSKLFVPATRPELFAKAEASAADCLSFDLEDAVAETRKDEAREVLAAYLRTRQPNAKAVVVRINAVTTPWFGLDLEAIGELADIINLPMADSAGDVLQLAELLESQAAAHTRIMVNIETPLALRRAAELALAHKRVTSLQIGYADLLEPYGIERRDEGALSHIRMTVRLAAAEAGIVAYDGAFAGVSDPDYFRQECLAARRQGLAGKSCIHPSQIAIVNQAFMPTEAEVARARRIVAAAGDAEAKGVGAFLVDGQMIDKPFLLRAREVLALAERQQG